MKRLGTVVSLSLALAGCMVGPDYERPQVPLAADWHADLKYKSVAEPTLADRAWVDIFKDPQLENVLRQALAQNKEMLIAIERVGEARARHRIVRGELFPTLDANLSSEREQESGLTETIPQLSTDIFLGASASWELDLWGKNRRANNAAYANYLASEYGAQAVRLSLIAEVCRAYFDLQGVDHRLEVSYDTLHSREKAAVIAEKRFSGGLTSKL
ncbi:MAG: TolC family protein, partial [Proteobacteria bacterium]|nr:TolC family protein [Pseudomonadota bacterium]